MWEYKRLKLMSQTPDQVFNTLNELGNDGWWLVQYEEKDVNFNPKDATYVIVLAKKLDNPTSND